MEKRKLSLLLTMFGILIVAIFAFIASQLLPAFAVSQPFLPVEPAVLAQQQQRIPTPVGAATKVPYSRPLPTRADDKSNATPTLIPPTRVRLGNVTEIQPQDMLPLLNKTLSALPGQPTTDKYPVVTQDSTRRYQVRSGRERYDTNQRTFVFDISSGQSKQLGHDGGSSYPAAITDQYLLWWFRCYENCGTNSPASGLYLYEFGTGTITQVSQDIQTKRDYEVDGRWIGYIKPTSGPGIDKPTTYSQHAAGCFGDLYVYNLDTKKEQLIDSTVPWECMADSGFFALSNNRLVWTHFDASGSKQWTLGLMDLKSGQSRTIKIPYGQGTPPYGLSFSGDYVVWGIFGYDFRQDVVFNFSLTIPGWENVLTDGALRPVMKDDRVYWGESVKGQMHYFSAPLIRVTNPYPGP